MGFWDFQNDAQLAHDNSIYPVTRKDREIMQKGEGHSAYFAEFSQDLVNNKKHQKEHFRQARFRAQ